MTKEQIDDSENENLEPDMSWMQTFTGREVHPFDLVEEDVCIEDVAHSLALTNRFDGHSKWPYSVAQHCVLAEKLIDEFELALRKDGLPRSPRARMLVLTHDASEAYLRDLPSVKRSLAFASYRELEGEIQDVVTSALVDDDPIDDGMLELVEWADATMLATEARDLMEKPPKPWGLVHSPSAKNITPWPWDQAEIAFLQRYRELNRLLKNRPGHRP